ncbi:universal stress protein [Segetibacter koreensis]|uniref:universal stress protein n=1 Tax=Segetibacter koreensis TaxID=398037 RepID=UPI00036C9B1D|nr:universal stress protein [Segetibacter koreensis]
MKTIVLACDGKNFSNAAFAFIKSLNEAEPILLTGAFFLSIDYRILIPSSLYPDPGPIAELVAKERVNAMNSVELFKQKCISNGIEYRLHEEGKSWEINDLVKESRFSDLLVMSEELFFKDWEARQPNHFMRQVIHNAECPVMVIPENYKTIEKILVAYDGKRQSLFALKLFSLLFPNFSNLEINIVYIDNDGKDSIPDIEYLEEYACRHYTNVNIEKLHFDTSNHFVDWVHYSKNALLVTGAFSRSGLSNLFRESFVEKLIKDHCIPVFIAHNL